MKRTVLKSFSILLLSFVFFACQQAAEDPFSSNAIDQPEGNNFPDDPDDDDDEEETELQNTESSTEPSDENLSDDPPPSSGNYSQFDSISFSKTLYVDSSVSSSGDGTQSKPLKNLSDISGKWAPGSVRVLLKRGSKWIGQSIPTPPSYSKDSQKQILISTYGLGERPAIGVKKGKDGIYISNSSTGVNNFAVVGIRFYAAELDAHAAIYWIGTGEKIRIEDCEMIGFGGNIQFSAPSGKMIKDIRLYRNIIRDAKSAIIYNMSDGQVGAKPLGLYAQRTTDLLIEENVVVNNGLYVGSEAKVPRFSWYAHQFYISDQNVRPKLLKNLVINTFKCNTSTHQSCDNSNWPEGPNMTELRSGGSIIGNLLVGNSSTNNAYYGPVTIKDNVLLEMTNLSKCSAGTSHPACPGGGVSGAGFEMGKSGFAPIVNGVISNNLIAHKRTKANVTAIRVTNSTKPEVKSNVIFKSGTTSYSSGNTISSDATPFVDANRTLAKYSQSIGLASSNEAFVNAAIQQSKEDWDDRLNADEANKWIRAGYCQMGKPCTW